MFEETEIWRIFTSDRAEVVQLVSLGLLAAGIIANILLGLRLLTRPPDWNLAHDNLNRRPWTFREGGMIVLALLNLQLVLVVLSFVFRNAPPFLWLVLNTIFFHMAGLVIILLFLRARRLTWRQAFGLEARSTFKHAALGVGFYLAAFPILVFSNALYELWLSSTDVQITEQQITFLFTESHTWVARIVLLGVALVIAPVAEETFFRGLGIPLIAKKWGIGPAVFLTSVVFAALHFHVPSFLPLFVISTGFSLAYIYSGSLLVPIVMHAVFNGVSLGISSIMN